MNKQTNDNHIDVNLPNGGQMTLYTKSNAHIPHLSKKRTSTHLFDEMNVNLLSVDQLCDDGCTVTFTATKAIVTKGNRKKIIAPRNEKNGMWVHKFDNDTTTRIDTIQQPHPIINNV